MAKALEGVLGPRIAEGKVTTKYGHAAGCSRVVEFEAGHPIVDGNTLRATEELLGLSHSAAEDDLVICLLSGGGSSLLEHLPDGISLADLQLTNELLLRSGITIGEVNAVRKHLSKVKGGQLACAVAPATCVSLILSDVIGDPPESIASGPTAPDPTTFADAWGVIHRFGLVSRLPESVVTHLQAGLEGAVPETLKPGDPVFDRVSNIIIGNNMEALEAAATAAGGLGYSTLVLTSRLQGEAREVARAFAGIVQEIRSSDVPVPKPACLLMGGETTVTVHGRGEGGRNQEFALAALLAMEAERGDYLIASCGTDGTDGPTDAAGAVATPAALAHARHADLDAGQFLRENDAHTFWKHVNGLIVTGPTGTNVMDLIVALIPA
jgi:hydroxypyruvate reductase